jgi:hypothetical protein
MCLYSTRYIIHVCLYVIVHSLGLRTSDILFTLWLALVNKHAALLCGSLYVITVAVSQLTDIRFRLTGKLEMGNKTSLVCILARKLIPIRGRQVKSESRHGG